MNKQSSVLLATCLSAAFALPHLASGQIAFDDFESNSLSGGTGWTTANWNHSGNGGHFVDGSSNIDGTHAGALWADAGTSFMSRNFTTIDSGPFTATWSIKGLQNMFEIGVNLTGKKSDFATNIITVKFDSSNTGLRLNDGGSDFTATSDVTYSDGAIYDFTLSGAIGSAEYSWSVEQRGGNSASNSPTWVFSGSAAVTEFSGFQFFWQAPAGPENYGLIDNVAVIPEPATYTLFMAFVILFFLGRRNLPHHKATKSN